MTKYGLIGKNISYSFSRGFFAAKFEREGTRATYENFDLDSIIQFPVILEQNPELRGLNVTIPYKQSIMPFLDELDPEASEIGAVNTIKIEPSGKTKGFNTDYLGFLQALKPHLDGHQEKALILGTGGASKAVVYALNKLGIESKFVSRNPGPEAFSYEDLNKKVLSEHSIIINCTPLGTSPNTSEMPPIPVSEITSNHLVFDLIYNPPITKLMELSKLNGAVVLNGMKMLELQAEKAWEIWNSK